MKLFRFFITFFVVFLFCYSVALPAMAAVKQKAPIKQKIATLKKKSHGKTYQLLLEKLNKKKQEAQKKNK